MKRSFKIGKAQINLIGFEQGWIQGICDISVNAFILIAVMTGFSIFSDDFSVIAKYLLYSGIFMAFMICLLWFRAKLESRKKKK